MKGGRCSPAFHRICAGCALLPAALFVGTPTLPAPAAKDTRTLLPAPPPYPRLRQRIPVHSCRQPHSTRACGKGYPYTPAGNPHPTRAFGAPPPPPPGGGVRAWRYLVGSRVRGATGGKPYSVLLRLIPVHWTVGISPLGVGPTGRGNLFPLPCLSCSKFLISPATPTLPAPSAKDTRTLLPATPTPPAPSALLPRPHRGAGSVRGDTWWAAVSGVEPAGSRARFFAGLFPDTGPCGYRHGGRGRRGGGTCSSSPVSHAPDTLPPPAAPPRPRLRRDTHTLLAGPPTPPAPAALLPRPHRGAGSVRGDTWWAAVSGVELVGSRARFFSRISPCCGPWGISPRGVGPTGRGNSFPLPCLSRSRYLASAGNPHPARAFAGGYPCTSAGSPHPTRARGSARAYTWWAAVPREQRWRRFSGGAGEVTRAPGAAPRRCRANISRAGFPAKVV